MILPSKKSLMSIIAPGGSEEQTHGHPSIASVREGLKPHMNGQGLGLQAGENKRSSYMRREERWKRV